MGTEWFKERDFTMSETKVNYEFLNELDAELMLPKFAGCKGKWVGVFREFMASESKYVLISFATKEEKASCLSCLTSFKKRYNLDLTWGRYQPGIRIWVAKA